MKRYICSSTISEAIVRSNFLQEVGTLVEYFSRHNRNLNKEQLNLIDDLFYYYEGSDFAGIRNTIEQLRYNSKGFTKEQSDLFDTLYIKLFYADGMYKNIGR